MRLRATGRQFFSKASSLAMFAGLTGGYGAFAATSR